MQNRLRTLLASAFALSGILFFMHAVSSSASASLSTIVWRSIPTGDVCIQQGNNTTACTGCLRNECRTNPAPVALEHCRVSCSAEGASTVKGTTCVHQGNGTAPCMGCLKNECKRNNAAGALESCSVSCQVSTKRPKGDPCLNQGNGSLACNGCLKNECKRNPPSVALESCQRSCQGAAQSSQGTSTAINRTNCTTQGNGTARCKDCLERRCGPFSPAQAISYCTFYCR